MYNNGSYVAV